MLELILKDIDDPYIRENFFRLSKFLNGQVLFDGEFELFDVTCSSTNDNFAVKHGLKFIPADIIVLAVEGNQNVFFRYQFFDRDFIYIDFGGATRVRFLAGKLKDPVNRGLRDKFAFVPFGQDPGAPPSGSAPRLIVQFNTDVGTAVGDLVRVNGVSTVTRVINNSLALIPNGIFGIAYNKPSPVLVDVIFIGVVGGYAGFTTGSPLFVSTTGTPAHTVPATGIVQQIGFAVSTTELFLQKMIPTQRAT